MPSDKHVAIIAIDPGVTTGVAAAVIDLGQGMVGSCMRRAIRKDVLQTGEVTGNFVEQVWEIDRTIQEFFFRVHIERQWVQAGRMSIAIESFELRQMAADLAPIRIISGLEVLLSAKYGDDFEMNGFYWPQTASEAKGFCSDGMLQKWGLWDKRSPHERDATRHLAKRVDRFLKGN